MRAGNEKTGEIMKGGPETYIHEEWRKKLVGN
jgi:hypothetical protein